MKVKKLVIIIVFLFCLIRFVPTGFMINKKTIHEIETPFFSFFNDECCMFMSSFTSLKSYATLKFDLDNMVCRYEKVTCDDKVYYYDKDNDVSIFDYGVEFGLPFNKFYIGYIPGYPDVCNVES